MTRDDILRMAREAGFANVRGGLMDNGELSDYWDCWPSQLERFAALVAAAKDAEHQRALAHQQRSYEREIQLEVEAERERIIQFLQEMQRQVGDAHNHYGHAAVRIKEGV
jgi:hypothetical protein